MRLGASNFLGGRSNRREYWLIVGIVIALGAMLTIIAPGLSSSGASAAIVVAQIRRFHDLGRTGWWAGAIVAAQLAIALPLAFSAVAEDLMYVAVLFLTMAPIVALGALGGQPTENRFGPPPGGRDLSKIFS